MAQIEMGEQRFTGHMDCSLKKSVTEVVAELTIQLHTRMTYWESRKGGGAKRFNWNRGQLRALLQPSTVFG